MHLDPERLTLAALEAAANPAIAQEPSVYENAYGIGTLVDRRIVRGVMYAVCRELSAMFADGAGLEAETSGSAPFGVDDSDDLEAFLEADRRAEQDKIAAMAAEQPPDDAEWREFTPTETITRAEATAIREQAQALPIEHDVAEISRLSYAELGKYAERYGVRARSQAGQPRKKADILADLEALNPKEA